MQSIKELLINPCAICRKRETTQLCDFITSYSWTSHTDNFGSKLDTCDLPMCKECSKNITAHDFCPYHFKMLDRIKNPDSILRKRTDEYIVKKLREQGYL